MTTASCSMVPIRERTLEIQASWSSEERRRRAREGKRRSNELLSLLMTYRLEPEIWAVGAPVMEDSKRIAV